MLSFDLGKFRERSGKLPGCLGGIEMRQDAAKTPERKVGDKRYFGIEFF